MKPSRLLALAGVCTTALICSQSATAAPLAIYGAPIDYLHSPACLTVGDAVSCSAPLLNYLAAKAPTTLTTQGGYVLSSPQGALKTAIVLAAGGAAALDNWDTTPTSGAVENGFKTNVGNDKFFATGKTSTEAGNAGNPANNGLMAGADLPGTWDVGLAWLHDALTINDQRRGLMIGFDYNQTQSTATSLSYWSLITLRDLNPDTSSRKADINFEIWNTFGLTDTQIAAHTPKTIDDKPVASDFSVVNGVTCVDSTGTKTPQILPIPGGQCPSGYDVTINNAQSTSTTEIFAFLPTLNANLEGYISEGYDVASVRMEFGCFKNNSTDKFVGDGYLADSGQTTNCDNGGFGDVYLLAAGTWGENVPEPGSLALLGMGLLGLTIARQRTNSRKH